MQHALPAYYIIAAAEATSNLARYDGIRYGHRTSRQLEMLHQEFAATRSEAFGAEVKRRIVLGSYVLSSSAFESNYMQAQKIRRKV